MVLLCSLSPLCSKNILCRSNSPQALLVPGLCCVRSGEGSNATKQMVFKCIQTASRLHHHHHHRLYHHRRTLIQSFTAAASAAARITCSTVCVVLTEIDIRVNISEVVTAQLVNKFILQLIWLDCFMLLIISRSIVPVQY